jgi:hypothetical protein
VKYEKMNHNDEQERCAGGIMKSFYVLLLLVAFSVIASGQSAISNQIGSAKLPFTLEITAELDKQHPNDWDFVNSAEKVVNVGSMIVVGIRKTNISDHEIIKWPEIGGPFGDHFEIRDSNGNVVEWKKLDNSRIGGEARITGTKDMVMQPEEIRIDTAPLSTWFDMSQPGTYTIQISQHISNDPASDVVKSNIITLTVLPADDKQPAKQ